MREPLAVRVARICGALAAAALLLMMLATVADVLMADLFKRPITGVYDLVQATLVVAVFLGFPATFLADGHIKVDVVDFYVSARTRRRLTQLAGLVTTTTLAFLAWHMVRPAMDAYKYGERMQELGIPNWVLWVPMIIGVALSALIAWRSAASHGAEPPDTVKGRQ